MKQRAIKALQDTPFAILLAIVSRVSLLLGLFVIAVYVVNKTFEMPKISWVNGRPRKRVN